MNALILDNKVVQVSSETFPVAPELIWVDCPDNCTVGWTYLNGELSHPVIPEPTQEQIMQPYLDTVVSALLVKAQERNYDNQYTIATYVSSTNVQWQAESVAFVAWRDAMYEYSLDIMNQVLSEQIQLPSLDEFVLGFPAFAWP